ncbi:uncharacterized protein PG998_006762 [Apiospora kogelbergensis]|uniref:Uncharacterized protein n=1 Tax=Apiospora kogelbergensis TaxID=1337665 RepID=A0AAW0QGY8_9PEZI
MQFSLPTAVILFCATTALAFPQADSFDNLIARDDEALDVVDVDLNADDFEELVARKTRCENKGLIKRVKKEYKGKCAPKDSKGIRDAHNCKDKEGGKSYLCVVNNKAACYNIKDALSKEFFSGECFK